MTWTMLLFLVFFFFFFWSRMVSMDRKKSPYGLVTVTDCLHLVLFGHWCRISQIFVTPLQSVINSSSCRSSRTTLTLDHSKQLCLYKQSIIWHPTNMPKRLELPHSDCIHHCFFSCTTSISLWRTWETTVFYPTASQRTDHPTRRKRLCSEYWLTCWL